MKHETKEAMLLNFAKETLDHSIHNMDAQTLSRLQSARQAAYSHSTEHHVWVQPAWALAAACVMIFVLALWNMESPEVTPTLPFEDVDILVNADGWEFYDDLEFYSWLAEDEHTG